MPGRTHVDLTRRRNVFRGRVFLLSLLALFLLLLGGEALYRKLTKKPKQVRTETRS